MPVLFLKVDPPPPPAKLRLAMHAHLPSSARFLSVLLLLQVLFLLPTRAADYTPFEGEKTTWHDNFARFDYLMDEATFAITPFKRPDNEKFAVGNPPKGQRRCIVVVPEKPAPGNPWSWQGCYWDHEPQTEVELLHRGFHIVFVTPDPGPQWDAWYAWLVEKHGLSPKPAFVGMSKGGVNEYDWTTANPDKVSCIYADNPAIRPEAFNKLGELAKRDVPLLNVCGSLDFLLQRHTLPIEDRYHQLGGAITVMIKEGTAHHPHSIRNPKIIADWIEQHMKLAPPKRPSFADAKFAKSYYYSLASTNVFLKEENTYATCRGPGFTPTYDRYDAVAESQWGLLGMSILLPKNPIPGLPWILKADAIQRDDILDQSLLDHGYTLVIPPLTAQSGAVRKQWDEVYQMMLANGYDARPVLEGTGAAAGEAYAWAGENTDKVSCIIGRNPVLRSTMSKTPPREYLAVLAKAGLPILHLCEKDNPWFPEHTQATEQEYQKLGVSLTVMLHNPEVTPHLDSAENTRIVEFIGRARSLPPGPISGPGQYFKLDYAPSTAPGELSIPVTYTVWIPENVRTLRGIIVHQHGAGTTASIEGATSPYDLHWQALARKHDCALFGASYHVQNEKIDTSPGASENWFDPRHGSGKIFLRALTDFAAKTGHPEFDKVPWALWGHSGGGIWSDVMVALHPDRVAAVWMRSGTSMMFLSHPEFKDHEVPSAVYAIPMMANPGIKEKPRQPAPNPDTRSEADKMKGPYLGSLATFRAYRAKGALIAFAPDPRTGHECGDSRYLAIPFFDACLAARLPAKGSTDSAVKPMDTTHAWLAAPLSEEAVPAADYKGNAAEANWFPNEAVAKAWMEYVKTGAVPDTTPPPAPSDVQAAAKGDQGVEITWNATADFESGIRSFIIQRDDQDLAQVPEKPIGKFGRPLFQSMTYHDTPAQPLPAMRYVDATAKPGEKHTYRVITVNTVGLKSEPAPAK